MIFILRVVDWWVVMVLLEGLGLLLGISCERLDEGGILGQEVEC